MPQRGMEGQKTKGYSFTLVDGDWKFKKEEYYASSLKEFPVVGEIGNPDKIIEKALLEAMKPILENVKGTECEVSE